MANWLVTREVAKEALGASGSAQHPVLDRQIAAASKDIEERLNRRFFPRTQTRYFRWPPAGPHKRHVLYLDEDLLSVTSLKVNNGATTVSASDYFLEPANEGPPYTRVEIDLASTAELEYTDTHQRAVELAGLWGYSQETAAAGVLAAAISSTSATSVNVSDASLVGVGDTLLVGSEQLFVTEKSALTTGTTLNDTLQADPSDVTVTVASGAAVKQGEVILLDSERMLVESVSGNDLTVRRAYDGSALAAHSTGITVYAFRTLTVERGKNGTTASTHSNGAAVSRYVPPEDIQRLALASVIFAVNQDKSGQTGVVGQGEALVRVRTTGLDALWAQARSNYRVPVFA